jgi:hypothetical protein
MSTEVSAGTKVSGCHRSSKGSPRVRTVAKPGQVALAVSSSSRWIVSPEEPCTANAGGLL